jgi:hypothetical protein
VGGDLGVGVGVLGYGGCAEILFRFGFACAPGDVVDIAEGVDIDCVYVGGGEKEVLEGL